MNIASHIVVADAAEAADWYAKAFGARALSRIPLPGNKVMTVELGFGDSVVHGFGDSVVHVGSEFPDSCVKSALKREPDVRAVLEAGPGQGSPGPVVDEAHGGRDAPDSAAAWGDREAHRAVRGVLGSRRALP